MTCRDPDKHKTILNTDHILCIMLSFYISTAFCSSTILSLHIQVYLDIAWKKLKNLRSWLLVHSLWYLHCTPSLILSNVYSSALTLASINKYGLITHQAVCHPAADWFSHESGIYHLTRPQAHSQALSVQNSTTHQFWLHLLRSAPIPLSALFKTLLAWFGIILGY